MTTVTKPALGVRLDVSSRQSLVRLRSYFNDSQIWRDTRIAVPNVYNILPSPEYCRLLER